MPSKYQHPILAALASFIGIGIFITLLIVGVIFFSYLLIIGGFIGLTLFIIAYIRSKFVKPKLSNPPSNKKHSGRTIDQ